MCDPASLRLSARVTLASTEAKFQKKIIIINKATAIKKVQSFNTKLTPLFLRLQKTIQVK